MTTNNNDYFYDTTANTMYYTTPQGTIDTITIDTSNNSMYTLDTSPLINTHSITGSWTTLNDVYKYELPIFKEFEDVMPDLTKIKEMCKIYPALDKAFENFKAIYDLTKDDYEARKNNDS